MTSISPQILLQAYAVGIFPMAETAEDNALYWVEPDERGIIPLRGLHISHSLRKQVRKQGFEIRVDTAFADVMAACAAKTETRKATWINRRIRTLYTQLHKMDCCHSVECWKNGDLVGGLYGVKIGAAFFGESMFSRVTDASKVALVHLVARLNAGGFELLDAQFMNPHLQTLGAMPISKAEYQKLLAPALEGTGDFKLFKEDADPEKVLHFAGLR
jgi:leucyl/phenylalanyl-tRNA---protein transferase